MKSSTAILRQRSFVSLFQICSYYKSNIIHRKRSSGDTMQILIPQIKQNHRNLCEITCKFHPSTGTNTVPESSSQNTFHFIRNRGSNFLALSNYLMVVSTVKKYSWVRKNHRLTVHPQLPFAGQPLWQYLLPVCRSQNSGCSNSTLDPLFFNILHT